MRVEIRSLPPDPLGARPYTAKETEGLTPEDLHKALEKAQGNVAHERDQILERHEEIVQAAQERSRKERQEKQRKLRRAAARSI